MNRKFFNLMLALVLALSLSTSALAQGNASPSAQDNAKSYIIILANDPIATYSGEVAGYAATEPEGGQKVEPESAKARKYEKFLEDKHDKSLRDAGASTNAKVHDYTIALNGYSAILTESQADAVKSQKDVLLVLDDQMRYAQTDSSGDFLGLTVKGGAYDSGITGEDVVVGIIDSGIWPEHPSFADDGSYAPLPDYAGLPCEFGNTAHNPEDAPFTCNNKLLGARQMLATYRTLIGAEDFEFDSARDDDGHGTHTASTAAGNAGVEASMYGVDLGKVSGIAPRARIIAYKGLGAGGGFTSDLASAIDQAVADGVDVINYSIGGGSSVPNGADDIAFLFAADAGVFVATSAGNAGPDADTVGSPGNAPWLTTVGANTQERFFAGTVVLGSDGGGKHGKDLDVSNHAGDKHDDKNKKKGEEIVGASLTPGTGGAFPLVDAEFAGGDLCLVGTLDPTIVAGKIVLCRRGGPARVQTSLAVSQAGGVGVILYNNSDNDNLFTDTHYVPSVHINNTDGLRVKAYIASTANPMAEIKNTGDRTKFKAAPSMTYFSSRGPNGPVPDIIKPDITAPGLQILAGQSPYADPFGFEFQAIAGTSMSSPHIAGVFALLKQAHPDWSAAMAKSALMTTADQKVKSEDQKTQATPFEMGSGQVNPGKVDKKGSAFNPGLVYDAGLFEYAAFTCGADLGIFSPGSCNFLAGLGIPSDASDLNYPSIGIAELAGSQTVVRTVTSVADRSVNFEAKVEAPKGYEVTVNPKKLRLSPGESATFEVTITNKKAPVGEWRFGSLTWKGSGYEVYSPIAVNGALFDAPDEVAGTGATGTASFDVQFGYTGSYTAGAHGLVPSTVLSGSIGQDPDQTYPSSDDAPGPGGGVDKFSIPLTGSAYLRIALSIPGDDDIDLYLEDSGGNIIAASTNGGTDELIDLALPADDTYTLVVHGWSVPSAPLAYAIDTWSVPLATGGSLFIDSAPASATLGAVETITVSWSGLAPGHYLGAVSHTGDVGLMGLTLVDVISP